MKKILFLVLLGSTLFGCSKKCDKPSKDENTGIIVPGSVVKEVSNNGSGNIIRSGNYEVSFNDGVSYEQIDWDEYNVVRFPMVVTCNVQLVRNVEIDYNQHIVDYTVTVNSCPDCADEYGISNMVLVPKIPQSFELRLKRIDNELK